jgi:hypothetical protein
MRTRILLLLILIVASSALLAPSLASAGTYTVLGCQTDSGTAAPMDRWQVNFDGEPALARWKDNCPSSAIMGLIPTSQHPAGEIVSETLTAPPGITIVKYTFWRAVRLYPGSGYIYQQFVHSPAFGWTHIEGCTAVGKCGTYGNYQQPTASANHEPVTPPVGTTQVLLEVLCGSSTACPTVSNPNEVWLFKTAELLQDDSSPQFASAPSGPLVSGGVLSGVEPVSIGATDQGSGVYQAEIEVDGQVLDTQVLDNSTGTCQLPFTAMAPCPLSASGTINFNTGQPQIPDGTHSLRILVTDPAGNKAVWGPITITTVNSPCSPIPAAGGMTLNAAIAQRLRHHTRFTRTLTIRDSQHPTIDGSLTAPTGTPVANAPLCVATQADYAGAPLKEVAALSTSGAGTFSYRLPSGPSRTVYIIHRVPGGAIAATVKVNVKVPVTVHINAHRLRDGQVMTWTGKLPGPIPDGLIVTMQVWEGSNWSGFTPDVGPHRDLPVMVARTGRWVAPYRFLRTHQTQTYVFRVLVTHQSMYPYAPGFSRTFRVTVTG